MNPEETKDFYIDMKEKHNLELCQTEVTLSFNVYSRFSIPDRDRIGRPDVYNAQKDILKQKLARDILKIALEMNLKKVNGEGLGTTFMGCPIYITPCVPEGSVLMHPKDYVKYLHELIYR